MERGETITCEDRLFRINCRGHDEDASFTLCHSPVHVEGGGVGGTLVVLQETTAARERLRLLQEEAEKLKMALASMDDAVFVDAFVTYHRFKDKAECSRNFSDCSRILDLSLVSGQPVPPEMWAVPRALRGEIGRNVEYSLVRKDTGETWIGSYNFSPMHNRDSVLVGAVVTARDVTEKKLAEREIAAREKKYRTLFEINGDALLPIDAESGQILDANPNASQIA